VTTFEEPTLFDTRGLARRTDPQTSHDAADTIGDQAERAIRRLYAIPRHLTDDEICDLLPELYPPTVKSARSRLTKAGFLVGWGTEPSARGRAMTVWKRNEPSS
jgi:hypothetical protein